MDGVAKEGLYVALWRSSGQAWLPSHGKCSFSPRVLGSHPVLVALHLEGTEVVLAAGADDEVRLALVAGNLVLAHTSGNYYLVTRGGAPRLLVVVGTRMNTSSTAS